MHAFSVILLFAAVAFADLMPRNGCNRNNCFRAVQGTVKGTAQATIAKSDCSRFLQQTVTSFQSTITVTATSVPSVSSTTRTIPAYASPCSGTAPYSSACSCWGNTASISTVSGDIKTVTISSSSIASTTTETISWPTFSPVVPPTYDGCFLDPATAQEFDLLPFDGAIPVINNNGVASLATVIIDSLDQYHFSKPSGSPPGVYDIVLISGGQELYYSVFASGKVGFTSTSSNGQTWVTGSNGEKYITTIFNVACNGEVSAGIIGGVEFDFTVLNNNIIVDNISAGLVTRRDIPVPKGFLVLPTTPPTSPVSTIRCPNPAQFAVSKSPPVPPVANGCGAAKGFSSHAPNLDFKGCCDGHDICYGTCPETFKNCNSVFLTCMLNQCDTLYPGGGFKHWSCTKGANFYGWAVTTNTAAGAFTAATKESCDCKCTDPNLTACADKCFDIKTDPQNCGQCYFNCPTGKCTNGACAFNSCTNLGTCSTFSGCGAGGSCVCASLADGTGFCVDGQTPCAGLAACGNSADCGLGSVCAVGSCCGRNVCVTTDVCGGKNVPRLLRGRNFVNSTIANKGVWVDEF